MSTRLLIFLILCAHLAAGPVTWARESAPAAPAKDANTPAEEAPAAKSEKSAAAATAKDAAAPAEKTGDGKFDAAHLEQMVAPVALYPDSLLMQLLMAATYPLEIVEAARWAKDNPKVTGDAIDAAIKEEDWDPSVKSLCRVPDVLAKMNENLDWTRDLGDAFLGQQSELLDAVQRMRQKAKEAGHLKSTKEQTVTVQEDKTIVIKESSTEVIYVPSYNPTVVYGPAWPPPVYYAPMYVYPPGAAFFTFSFGFAMGAAMWGGCNWGWGHSDVDIDINNYNNFNRNTNINTGDIGSGNRGNGNVGSGNRPSAGTTGAGGAGGGKQKWEHNPEHRKGVNYKSADTAQRFGGSGTSNRVSSAEARGYSARGGTAGNRPSTADRSRNTGAGASTANRGGGSARNTGAGASTANRGGSRDSAFSGSNNASFDRAASQRGSASRSGGASRSGASRSGGGRGGGGGGRRR